MKIEDLLKEIETLKLENKNLKETNESLQKEIDNKDRIIYSLNEKLESYIKKYDLETEKKRIIEVSKFVPKTERTETIINEAEDIIKTEKKDAKKRGIKQGSKKFTKLKIDNFKVETIYEDPSETKCPKCGHDLVIASEKERFIIEYVPSTLKVYKIIKRTKKCPICNKNDSKLYYPIAKGPFPGSILTPSFASWILYNKYDLGIPFNRLEEHIKSTLGIEISKQSLATYAAKCSTLLLPIFEKLKSDLLDDPTRIIHADETTLSIYHRPEYDKERKKSYVFVYRCSLYSPKQMMIYSFHETREIGITNEWLKNFNGTLVCDDYNGYNSIKKSNPNIKFQKCMAHARRRFADILKAVPKKERKNTKSYEILELFKKIFNFEKEYKKEKLTPNNIVIKRKEDQIVIKDKLEKIIFANLYVEGSALLDAINYVRNIWADMWTYLDNGYLDPTNNSCERAVKPFVIQRKVFQTAGSYAGAKYTTILFSIIQSAKTNNLNVMKYLEFLINEVNNNKESLDKLMPYSKEVRDKFSNKI